MKKILLTGGCGFIGSNLTDYLIKKRCKVSIIDNFTKNKVNKTHKNAKLYKLDVVKINNIKKIKNVDIVVHLAASADILIGKQNEKKYFHDNIYGLQEVLNFCTRNKVKKFIFASSASVYGDTKNKPVKENFTLNPSHYYAYTKFIGEKMIKTYSKVNSLTYSILRFFNIYGPKSDAVVSTFLAQKIQGKIMTIYGNGRQKRDFLHIDDLCSAIWKTMNQKVANNKIYNLGSGKSLSINNLKSKICYEKFINLEKRNDDIEISIADIFKAKKELKWKPKILMDEGLKRILKIDYKRLKKLKIMPISKQKKIIKIFNKKSKIL